MRISIIVPIYNEELSVKDLILRLNKVVLNMMVDDYEIIIVDDGSTDKTLIRLKEEACHNKKIKIISFKRNFGQTAAISAGINNSSGEIIITIDSDLENYPEDIPLLLGKLEEGYDVVSGWRKDRWKGKFLTRKMPSLIANYLISKVTKVNLHDFGCTLKAYRRNVLMGVALYGEMHRFIPVYTSLNGAKITEITVRYTGRIHGKSNYNLSRIFKVLLDLFTMSFLLKYFDKPMHFFGKFGFWILFFSFISGFISLLLKFIYGVSFILTPLPLLTVFLLILGVQFILMGLLAEILIRIYFGLNKDIKAYSIKETINL